MLPLRLVVAGLLWSGLGCAQGSSDVQSSATRESDDRTLIFDGESLAGWEGDPAYWSVEDGAIVGRTSLATPLARTTYLIWRGGEVRDFELELEFRFEGTVDTHPRANSGVQFRGRELGRYSIAGYQADLAHEPGLTGTLYEQFGSRQLMARQGEEVSFGEDGGRELERFAKETDFTSVANTPGWHRLRVLCVGADIELAIDGRTTVKVADRHRLFSSTSGKLALQLHSGPPQEVSFRKLRLRDLGGKHDGRPRVDPQWIWSGYTPEAGEEAWFRREFRVAGEVKRALLWGMADDALEVYLNGQLIATAEGHERMLVVQPLTILQGKNVLSAWVRNEEAEAGLFLSLRLRQPNGLTQIGTDANFRVAREEVPGWNLLEHDEGQSDWSSAVSFGPLGTEPWGVAPTLLMNPQVQALDGAKVRLPDGFRSELIYSVPRARQGSWVALTFDDRGRAITSDENGALYRVELPEAGAAARAVRLPIDGAELGEAQGLLHAFGALYVSVSRSHRYPSGLYRLRDTTGDDRFDQLSLLRAFEGEGEHGPHALLEGPDGMLYLFAGDEVALPADARASFGATLLPAGLLPPRIFVPPGRAGEMVRAGRTGWVVRTDPDGKRFELFAYGLRNAYDGAFDAEGELFTFDSDMEWDLGLPWYRASRLYHLVHGGDYGARFGTGKWPYSFGDTLPPALEVGRTSPTGMIAGHQLRFGPRFGRALFAGDWLNGTILAFFPEARGSSFGAGVEVFAQGEPLQVTDLAAGPDGALYFTTGGRSTQSGLYRIVADTPAPPGRSEPDPKRTERRSVATSEDPELLRRALGSSDRFLRHAARFALEQRGQAELTKLSGLMGATTADVLLTRELLLARARVQPAQQLDALADELDRIDPADLRTDREGEGLGWYLRTSSIVLQRRPDIGETRRENWIARLLPLFPTPERLLDRELAVLLVELRAQAFTPLAVARLSVPEDAPQESLTEAFYYAFLLRDVRVGWTDGLHAAYFNFLNRATLELVGGYDVPILLSRVRRMALARIGEEQRQKLGPLLIPPSAAAAGVPVSARGFVRDWSSSELLALIGGLTDERDLKRGAEVYREASCSTCHVFRGVGVHRAPELSSAGSRLSPEDLLMNIVEPSEVITEAYRTTVFELADGELEIGRVLREGPTGVLLVHDTPPYDTIFLPADEIVERWDESISSMPSGLLNTHTEDEILDLLAYLLAN